MDERQYRSTYRAINERRCHFEKSVLARGCTCGHLRRFHLGDREGAACGNATAHARCADWLALLHGKTRFVWDRDDIPPPAAIPHRLQMKLQTGGMRGLAEHLGMTEAVPDIARLLDAACAQHGGVAAVPLGEVIAGIADYEPRRRGVRKQ